MGCRRQVSCWGLQSQINVRPSWLLFLSFRQPKLAPRHGSSLCWRRWTETKQSLLLQAMFKQVCTFQASWSNWDDISIFLTKIWQLTEIAAVGLSYTFVTYANVIIVFQLSKCRRKFVTLHTTVKHGFACLSINLNLSHQTYLEFKSRSLWSLQSPSAGGVGFVWRSRLNGTRCCLRVCTFISCYNKYKAFL